MRRSLARQAHIDAEDVSSLSKPALFGHLRANVSVVLKQQLVVSHIVPAAVAPTSRANSAFCSVMSQVDIRESCMALTPHSSNAQDTRTRTGIKGCGHHVLSERDIYRERYAGLSLAHVRAGAVGKATPRAAGVAVAAAAALPSEGDLSVSAPLLAVRGPARGGSVRFDELAGACFFGCLFAL